MRAHARDGVDTTTRQCVGDYVSKERACQRRLCDGREDVLEDTVCQKCHEY